MRILLAHNSLFFPSHGGGDKSNRLLMQALAELGHHCRAAARIVNFGSAEQAQFVAELKARDTAIESVDRGVVAFTHKGVEVRTAADVPNLRAWFTSEIETFHPDVILTSTDDPAQLLLEAALRDGHACVVYMVRATIALPFGPDAAFSSEHKTAAIREADSVVCVSEYVSRYVREHSGIPAVALPLSMQDQGPFADLGAFDNEFVVMVNPCAVKGLPIFLELASVFPNVKFAAVPTWGTTHEDVEALRRHPNVTILEPSDDIDEILRRARILLLPSIWAEARARIVVEAMLRGVPVLASNVGGIPEAMMGVPHLLPVNMITHYEPRVNEQMVPVAVIPPQNIGPWRDALARMISDREHWTQIAEMGRRTARDYVANLSIQPLEQHLEAVRRAPRKERAIAATAQMNDALSPEKRRLLALRLQQRAKGDINPWLPTISAARRGALRLFCFPFAGGGVLSFRGWPAALGHDVAVCPVRLPGRETRSKEKPFESMAELIAALGPAIQPFLEEPFAFYGHSMGAGIAFELARWLRREQSPAPKALLVSAARAPQLRKNQTPPPSPSDAELAAFTGAPLTPALRADVELYRTWTYADEPPLTAPIFAYAGADDPTVTAEKVEAWREQTVGEFRFATFPGGHFFINEHRDEFLARLKADVLRLI